MPVRSVNGLRLAAMALEGEEFSEMKFSVVPLNCFHIFASLSVAANRWFGRHRALPATAPAVSLRKSRRFQEVFIRGSGSCLSEVMWGLTAALWGCRFMKSSRFVKFDDR